MKEGIATTDELAITGMSCAACAVRLEKVLSRLPGVSAHVNFATGRASVRRATGAADGEALVAAVRKAGFDVAPETLELALSGMSCAACAARIEKVLNRLPGVEATVNFNAETARVRYVPGLAGPDAMQAAVAKAGFSAEPIFARDRVMHVGEIVALVVAETVRQAVHPRQARQSGDAHVAQPRTGAISTAIRLVLPVEAGDDDGERLAHLDVVMVIALVKPNRDVIALLLHEIDAINLDGRRGARGSRGETHELGGHQTSPRFTAASN